MTRTAAATLGTIILVAGAVIVFVPEQIPPAAADAMATVNTAEFVEKSLLGAAGVVLFLSLIARASVGTLPLDPVTIDSQTESDRSVKTVGTDFDESVENHDLYSAGSTVPEPKNGPGLTETLIATLARVEDCSAPAARELLASGEWTDNRNAELLFATDPDLTLTEQARAWLRPEATFKRRVRAATSELAALTETLSTVNRGSRDGSDVAPGESTDSRIERSQ